MKKQKKAGDLSVNDSISVTGDKVFWSIRRIEANTAFDPRIKVWVVYQKDTEPFRFDRDELVEVMN